MQFFKDLFNIHIMFTKKKHLLIAITTFDHDALRVSVPMLGCIKQKFSVLIYNDNPDIQLEKKHIRKLGWRGPLTIINGDKNLGELGARLEIIKICSEQSFDWITFMDDDDMIISVDVPNVDDNVFAILQDAHIINTSHVEVLKIMSTHAVPTDTDKTGPNFDIRGTWIRPKYLKEFIMFFEPLSQQFNQIAKGIKTRFPTGAVLWHGINIAVKANHPDVHPMYMNQTNYISIRLGNAKSKYGIKNCPIDTKGDLSKTTIEKFSELFELAAKQNMVASDK